MAIVAFVFVLVLAGVTGALTGLAAGSSIKPAPDQAWCYSLSLTMSPSSGYTGDSLYFTFTVKNNYNYAVHAETFNVKFSWDANWYGTNVVQIIAVGGSKAWGYSEPLPSSQGTYNAQAQLHGYSDAPVVDDGTCTFTVDGFQVLPLPPAPTVAVNANRTSGTIPMAISFSAVVTNGLSPFTYAWNFGDGQTGSGQSAQHTYTTAGTFTASVTVTDSRQRTDTGSVSISASAPPLVATASATTTSGTAPLTVAFSGSASGGTSPYTYSWVFGDGGTSTQQNPSHTYQRAGSFNAVLTVTDSASRTSTKSVSISVTAPSGGGGGGGGGSVTPQGDQGIPLWIPIVVVLVVAVAAVAVVMYLRHHRAAGTKPAAAAMPVQPQISSQPPSPAPVPAVSATQPRPTGPPPAQGPPAGTIVCPTCRAVEPATAVHCANCGTRLR